MAYGEKYNAGYGWFYENSLWIAQTLDQQYEFLFPNLITAIAQSPPIICKQFTHNPSDSTIDSLKLASV